MTTRIRALLLLCLLAATSARITAATPDDAATGNAAAKPDNAATLGAAGVMAGDAIATAADAVLSAYPDARFLILGEVHGTQEIPALAAALAERFAARGDALVVGLEIPAQEQARVDAYLASDGGDAARAAVAAGPFWQVVPERSDGRRSVAKLALLDTLRSLHASHPDVRVLLFDDTAFFAKAGIRDAGMADVLRATREAAPDGTLLVLTGNLHAMRRVMTPARGLAGDFATPVPMASLLQDLGAVTLAVGARRGNYWVCMSGGCGVREVRNVSEGEGVIVTPMDDAGAYHARVLLPAFTAASPVPLAED